MRRAFALLILLATSACAYYNGLYNARGLVRRAESATRDGRDSAAIAAWREAAAKADTVIVRYPRSRWTDDALLLSGVSSALAGGCAHGLVRLAQWQSHPARNTRDRARATLARGACLVRLGEHARALDSLAPLVSHPDATLAQLAATWAARAALATGRGDSAVVLALAARSDALDAELATAALASNHPALTEKLLRQRATEWRSLSGMHAVLGALARVDHASADRVVQLTQGGRASRLERARLSVVAGAWSERDDDAQRARQHYERALRTTADTAVVADVIARLGLLEVRSAVTIGDARSRLERAKGKTVETAHLARVDTALRLAARLANAADTTGASLFLAAEVARDAVGARSLSRTLFLGAARRHPASSLAPKALLAAADLSPDSASIWRAAVRARYGTSPYAQLLDRKPVAPASLEGDERLLRQTWSRAIAIPDSASVATERRRP
jgi:tetratricopeptide (TPR) repeat protein